LHSFENRGFVKFLFSLHVPIFDLTSVILEESQCVLVKSIRMLLLTYVQTYKKFA
jgi:hypothetical protein